MAMLGFGDYLCEACAHFDTDGIDGNHPCCSKQGSEPHRAISVGDICPYGYTIGVPSCYPCNRARVRKRAKKILAIVNENVWGEVIYSENIEYEQAYKEGYDRGFKCGFDYAMDVVHTDMQQLRNCLRGILEKGEAPAHGMSDE